MSFPPSDAERQVDTLEDINQIDPLFQYPCTNFLSELVPEQELFSEIFDDLLHEVQLAPKGAPCLIGAESLGVFLNLPEELNLSASSCSDSESIAKYDPADVNYGKYVIKKTKGKPQDHHRRDIPRSNLKYPTEKNKSEVTLKRQHFQKISNCTSTKYKSLKYSKDNPVDQFPVRKRGRPRKYPVSNTLPLNLSIAATRPSGSTIKDLRKNINNPKRKKPNRLCTQCNTWFADQSTLTRHVKSQHILKKVIQPSNESGICEEIKIVSAWSPVDLSLTDVFSLNNFYRVRLNGSNYVYCTQVTRDCLFFFHPGRDSINGCVSRRSDKNILHSMDDESYSFQVSEMDFLSVRWQSVTLTSRTQFDTHALYRVRVNSQQYPGCFYSTGITPYDVIISLPTKPPSFAKVDFIVKGRIKCSHSSPTSGNSTELSVVQIEKLYCFWKRESTESGNQFEDSALFKSSVANKSIYSPHTYLSSSINSPSIKLAPSPSHETSHCERNKTSDMPSDGVTLRGEITNINLSHLDSICCYWMKIPANSQFSKNSLYRVFVKGSEGQSCNILITIVSPLSISYTPILPPHLPTQHQGSFVPSCYSTNSIHLLENFVEETNLPWILIDLGEKRQFNPWRLYRVQPFNHTSQSPNRSLLCTVVRKEVLHFSDPYNKNHMGVVSFSTKNIYDSISRTPYDNSICMSFPLSAMHELLASWSMVVLHSQTQFDTGYVYMVQINNQGHLFNLISLCVADNLLLFDSPNETGLIGKLRSSNKLQVVYQNASNQQDFYSVISLRFLTGVVDEVQSS